MLLGRPWDEASASHPFLSGGKGVCSSLGGLGWGCPPQRPLQKLTLAMATCLVCLTVVTEPRVVNQQDPIVLKFWRRSPIVGRAGSSAPLLGSQMASTPCPHAVTSVCV